MPDGHYVRCADCKTEHNAIRAYEIRTPVSFDNDGRPQHRTFWLCERCWERMISGAAMSVMRSM